MERIEIAETHVDYMSRVSKKMVELVVADALKPYESMAETLVTIYNMALYDDLDTERVIALCETHFNIGKESNANSDL